MNNDTTKLKSVYNLFIQLDGWLVRIGLVEEIKQRSQNQ